MGNRSEYRKRSNDYAWDLDRSCKKIVNQSSPKNREVKTILNRQTRARLKAEALRRQARKEEM